MKRELSLLVVVVLVGAFLMLRAGGLPMGFPGGNQLERDAAMNPALRARLWAIYGPGGV